MARAIYRSQIPVISAVGHEPDVTIADFVADLRAATPSNGAELAVPDQNELYAWLDGLAKRLEKGTGSLLARRRKDLERLGRSRMLTDPGPISGTGGCCWTTRDSGWDTEPDRSCPGAGAPGLGQRGAGRHEPAEGAGPGLLHRPK